jgi:hypothetical protein
MRLALADRPPLVQLVVGAAAAALAYAVVLRATGSIGSADPPLPGVLSRLRGERA